MALHQLLTNDDDVHLRHLAFMVLARLAGLPPTLYDGQGELLAQHEGRQIAALWQGIPRTTVDAVISMNTQASVYCMVLVTVLDSAHLDTIVA